MNDDFEGRPFRAAVGRRSYLRRLLQLPFSLAFWRTPNGLLGRGRRASKSFVAEEYPVPLVPGRQELAPLVGGGLTGEELGEIVDRLDDLRTAIREYEFNALHYGASGDGVSDDRDSLQRLANSIIPARGGDLVLRGGTFRIAGNLSIPKHVRLRIEPGARLAVERHGSITVNGPLLAGLYRAFSGPGSVTLKPGSVEEVLPEWWGAIGDANTDDRLPLQRAIAVAAIAGVPVTLTARYFVGETLEIAHDNVLLRGGTYKGGALLTNNGGEYPTLRVAASSNKTWRRLVRLERLRIDGQLYLFNCIDFGAFEVFIVFGHTHTLVIDGGWSMQFVNCQMQLAKSGWDVWITANPDLAPQREVNAVDFVGCRIEGGSAGGVGSNPDCKLQQVNFFGGVIETHTNPEAWGMDIPYARPFSVVGTYFEQNRAGNARFGSATRRVDGLLMQGVKNDSYGATRAPIGIHLVNVHGALVHGEHRGHNGPGVRVEAACSGVQVWGYEHTPSSQHPAGDTTPVSLLGQNVKSGLSGLNVARNGDFEAWNAGVPTGWKRSVGSEGVAPSKTQKNSGTYGLELTSAPGHFASLQQQHGPWLASLRGKRVYATVLAKATVAGRVRLSLEDGVRSVLSAYHPGDGEWHTLGVGLSVADAATQLVVGLDVAIGDGAVTSAYFDDCVVVVGADYSYERAPIQPLEYLRHLSGTVETRGTPATARVMHGLESDCYRVMTTPGARCDVWVTGKTANEFTINTSESCAVDYFIVPG